MNMNYHHHMIGIELATSRERETANVNCVQNARNASIFGAYTMPLPSLLCKLLCIFFIQKKMLYFCMHLLYVRTHMFGFFAVSFSFPLVFLVPSSLDVFFCACFAISCAFVLSIMWKEKQIIENYKKTSDFSLIWRRRREREKKLLDDCCYSIHCTVI